MSEIRARVQFGDNNRKLDTEVARPHTEIGDAMRAARSLGGVALEVIDVDLLEDKQWGGAVMVEGLPTLFDVEPSMGIYSRRHINLL